MKFTPLPGLAILALTPVAHAQITYSTGFESPTFTAGAPIEGNDGWARGSGLAAQILASSAQAQSGTQSAFLPGVVNPGFTAESIGLTYGGPTGTALNPVTLSASFFVDPATSPTNRFFSLQMSSGLSSGSTFGGISIDFNGNIRVGTGPAALSSAAGDLTTNRLADYQNRWITLSVTHTGTSIIGSVSGLGTSTGASSVTSSALARGGSFSHVILAADGLTTTNGGAYVDNFKVESVPEPTTMTVLGLAALIASKRKKKA